MHVVATAGHVDHGKSTLVQALTGTDPDRWAEEKRRGLTIDLGFASTTLPSGREVAFVDVPGHVRFLKNMLAGVGSVDALVFVVAATEGWKPQSEEHLRILEVLGARPGLVALTKVGRVDDDQRQLAAMDVADHLADTFLAGAPVVEVDALTGHGVAEVAAALDQLLATTPLAEDRGRPRLWVDRSFAAHGAGTIVTGTLGGGRLAIDDELVVLPQLRPVRVRGLQSHGAPMAEAEPGRRLALNLVGIDHRRVQRGAALVRPSQWHSTLTLDASLTVLTSLDHDVNQRGAHLAYVGSGEYPVRLRVLGGSAVEPGRDGFVRLHLPVALPLVPGDRYILRDAGRSETVGGGEVLDVDPQLPASRARPDRRVERVVAERGWVACDDLERLTGERCLPDVGRWMVAPTTLAAASEAITQAVDRAGPAGLDIAVLDERQRSLLGHLDLVVEGGRARRPDAPDPLADNPFLAALAARPFSPPAPDGVDRAELAQMIRRGWVVERDGLYFSAASVGEAATVVAGLLHRQPAGVTVAEVRNALGTSRKYLLPLLALLDGNGVTRRRGDVRVAGPRLPGIP